MRLGPLRHPWFAAFSGSVGLGGIGDEVARLALPLLILDLTHSIAAAATLRDRKSTRLNSSHITISYAVFCLKKKKKNNKCAEINKNKPEITCILPDQLTRQ